MVSVADIVGLLAVVAVNATLAALVTRFLRVRLTTRWGIAIYVLVLVPAVQVLATLLFTGPLGLGPDLGSSLTVLAVAVALPFALGVAFDYFWMPTPAEVELPETLRET
jgi:cell division protein FtsW (lipid II flippase)